jgi:flavin-dependent dehydrogenase
MHAPIAGALSQDGVADRTLLIGPAGGFYSACGEDIYPNVWSALYAVSVATQALKKPVLQDALDDYRSCWRTDLGFYLQGPQQNLRLLLPMVYRNSTMTARLAEAILTGKNVIHS